MEFEEIIDFFEENQNKENIAGMNRFKIDSDKIYGIKMDVLRKLAKKIGKDHDLALKLWDHSYHESRILATIIEEKDEIDEDQLDEWVNDFGTWDLCDQACINLLSNSPLAISKIPEWASSEKEFVKRTAFSLIAVIAVHDKKSKDSYFESFFPIIKKACDDNRNFVKKAVNWALRSIGKRNKNLNKKAIKLAKEISELDYKAAKWIAGDALIELQSKEVRNRLDK